MELSFNYILEFRDLSKTNFTQLQEAAAEEDGNFVFSPLSIQTALSFLLFGAGGETLKAMKKGLKYGRTSKDDLAKTFQELTEDFKATQGLSMANKLFVMEGFKIKQKFQSIAEKSFNSEAANINFLKKDAAAKEINGWVASKTNDMIKSVIAKEKITGDTKLVLVNAIYFKADWDNRFLPHKSICDKFYLNDKDTVEMTFMHQTVRQCHSYKTK